MNIQMGLKLLKDIPYKSFMAQNNSRSYLQSLEACLIFSLLFIKLRNIKLDPVIVFSNTIDVTSYDDRLVWSRNVRMKCKNVLHAVMTFSKPATDRS